MSPQELHQQAMDIVGVLLECDPEERAALLDVRCRDDEVLREEVRSLLEHERKTKLFSGEPLIDLRGDLREDEPEQIGPYRIVRPLGQGGMGAVYLVQQEEPIRRQVALKLINKGMNSDEIVRRFQTERNILANLQHPYIARFLDGGASGDGQPYFVMEYVEGKPIDDYCDRAKLSIKDRLELFRKVCSAVQLSHQNLVVHRDLKPSNILVDESGTPKLLDFGIAKLLRPGPDAQTAVLTAPGSGPMTREYASPEMVNGEGINTSSDIYSLGVVLYRLLTGWHPYRMRGRSFAEVDRAIREEEPKRPSVVVGQTDAIRSEDGIVYQLTPEAVSKNRRSDPGKLRRQLAGDLDSIVLKALRKEPGERYGSIVELAEDIKRHLDGLPVAARVDTLRYRTGKFVRRRRLELALVAAFLAMAVGSVLFHAERMRQERDRANMTYDFLIDLFSDTDSRSEEEILTPEGVISDGIDNLGERFAQDYDLQATIFNFVGRLYAQSGQYKKAISFLEGSLDMLCQSLGERHLLVAEIRLNLAYALGKKRGSAEMAVEQARLGQATLRGYYPSPHIELAKGISIYATQLSRIKRYLEAERIYFESHEIRIALYGEVHLSVARSFSAMGAMYQEKHDLEKALVNYQKSLKIRKQLLPPKHPDIAVSYRQVGNVLYEKEAYVDAEFAFQKALWIDLERFGDRHPHVATDRYRLALVLLEMERYEEAEPLLRQALKTRCVLGYDNLRCANVKSGLAKLLVARGHCEEGEVQASEARMVYEKFNDPVRGAIVEVSLGECLAAERRFEEAEKLVIGSHELLREELGDKARATEAAWRAAVRLYEAWGESEKLAEFRGSEE